MAVLKLSDGTLTVLASRHLIGRSRSMHTHVDDPAVSAQHAVLAWSGQAWHLRDLGSRNGTRLDDRRLEPGEDVPVAPGQVVHVAEGAWTATIASIQPPSVVARSGGQLVEGDGDLLALPSPEDPRLIVTYDDRLGWVQVVDDEPAPVVQGEVLIVDDRRWTLALPEALDPTASVNARKASLDDVSIALAVSADEEHVDVVVTVDGAPHPLPPRGHHYLLATLGRARTEDASRGVDPSEQGWLHFEDLKRMLRVTSNHLHVSLHRIRKDFQQLDLSDGRDVLERRPTSRQVRLSVPAERMQVR